MDVLARNLESHGTYRFWISGSEQFALTYASPGGPNNNLTHIIIQKTWNVVAIALTLIIIGLKLRGLGQGLLTWSCYNCYVCLRFFEEKGKKWISDNKVVLKDVAISLIIGAFCEYAICRN